MKRPGCGAVSLQTKPSGSSGQIERETHHARCGVVQGDVAAVGAGDFARQTQAKPGALPVSGGIASMVNSDPVNPAIIKKNDFGSFFITVNIGSIY